MEYRGQQRHFWSPFGAQFGEEFGEVLRLRCKAWQMVFGSSSPTASGNLVVDRTVERPTISFLAEEHM
jgi:hypothetical protein